jgi:hypothetical protein
MQVNATTRQKEKLASVLFEQKVSLKRLGVDDEGVKIHEMVSFAQSYRKPKDEAIRTRQVTFPGALHQKDVRGHRSNQGNDTED